MAQPAIDAASRIGIEIVPPEEVITFNVDILSPCALRGVTTGDNAVAIQAGITVGAANNQLVTETLAEHLHSRGILYVPDFLANAGGLIAVAMQIENLDEQWALSKAAGLADQLSDLMARSHDLYLSPLATVRRMTADYKFPPTNLSERPAAS